MQAFSKVTGIYGIYTGYVPGNKKRQDQKPQRQEWH